MSNVNLFLRTRNKEYIQCKKDRGRKRFGIPSMDPECSVRLVLLMSMGNMNKKKRKEKKGNINTLSRDKYVRCLIFVTSLPTGEKHPKPDENFDWPENWVVALSSPSWHFKSKYIFLSLSGCRVKDAVMSCCEKKKHLLAIGWGWGGSSPAISDAKLTTTAAGLFTSSTLTYTGGVLTVSKNQYQSPLILTTQSRYVHLDDFWRMVHWKHGYFIALQWLHCKDQCLLDHRYRDVFCKF